MSCLPSSPGLIKPLVFGGIDGLTTTLAIVWGSSAAGENLVSTNAVVVLGVANLLATGLSMGIGDYMGTVAEHEAVTKHVHTPDTAAAPRTFPAGGDDLEARRTTRAVKAAALRSGFTMFLSFIVFGGVPLFAYLPIAPEMSSSARRSLSTMLCGASFWALGAVRARMSDASVMWTAMTMALTGSAAAAVSFFASKFIYWLLIGAEPPVS